MSGQIHCGMVPYKTPTWFNTRTAEGVMMSVIEGPSTVSVDFESAGGTCRFTRPAVCGRALWNLIITIEDARRNYTSPNFGVSVEFMRMMFGLDRSSDQLIDISTPNGVLFCVRLGDLTSVHCGNNKPAFSMVMTQEGRDVLNKIL